MLSDSRVDSTYFVFTHFTELQVLNQNDSRKFTISRNSIEIYEEMVPRYLFLNTTYNSQPTHFENINYLLYMTNGSTLPPIINAVEVYKVRIFKQVSTKSEDAEAIRDIKAFYRLEKFWTGDPCAPREFAWDGLVCSYDGSPKIIHLNLKASGLNGFFRSSICNLKELQELDLSINKLTGPIPSCLAQLPELTLLNLTRSGLEGPVPKALLDKSKTGSLIISFEDKSKSPETGEGRQKILIPIFFIVVFFIVFGIFWLCNHRKTNKQQGPSSGSEEIQQGISPNNSDCRRFTYSELVKITNNFCKIIGGFGSVYHGILPNKVQVAVKVLSKASCQGPKEFQREAQILMKIHHKNLVPFVGYCNDEDHLALVYEYMAQGDLATHISGKAHILCWRDRLRIATEAAKGLEYLHKDCAHTIIHRDIKTSNILLDHDLVAKIADFGLSRTCNNNTFTQVTTTIMGTHGYLDPFSFVLDQRSDVYAFGVVLLELITGQPAITQGAGRISDWVKEHYKRGDLSNIVDNRLQGDYNANAVWKTLQMALECVSSDTNSRPDMSVVLALLKECLEVEHVSFTTSANFNTKFTSNFTTDSSFPGNENVAIGPFAR